VRLTTPCRSEAKNKWSYTLPHMPSWSARGLLHQQTDRQVQLFWYHVATSIVLLYHVATIVVLLYHVATSVVLWVPGVYKHSSSNSLISYQGQKLIPYKNYSEADGRYGSQQFIHLIQNLKVHYNSLSVFPVLSNMNTVQTLPLYFFQPHFNIVKTR
jgi:hypothetical protein